MRRLSEDPDRLVVEAGTLPMFGGTKVIRAIAGRRIDGKALSGLVGDATAAAFLVVEAGNLLPSSELRQLFEKSTVAAAVACYPDDQQTVGTVIDEVVRAARMTIDTGARSTLIHRLGADRAMTRNEIEKLVLFAHGRDTITQDDVDAIVGDAADLALDAIVNSAANGQVLEALQDTARAWAAGESAQSLIAALQRHLMRLHKARGALDQGASLDTILRQQRPPLNFKQQPIFSNQCRAWSLPSLTTALRLTAEAALDRPHQVRPRGTARRTPRAQHRLSRAVRGTASVSWWWWAAVSGMSPHRGRLTALSFIQVSSRDLLPGPIPQRA